MPALLAPLGTRMTVCSFTPSRIGIIISRRTKSKLEVCDSTCAGVSLGNPAELDCPVELCAQSPATKTPPPSTRNLHVNVPTLFIKLMRPPCVSESRDYISRWVREG